MASQCNNVEYYNKMEELQEQLRKSEEKRMLLQRQFDLMIQANREKEQARVAAVEARYKRYLDEDKRRRDRNSSLLQALDRIDSHTASLAAKTERMRMLRKQYEEFIAHAYPAWHLQGKRSFCPLAPLSLTSSPSIMGRVSEVSGYGTETPQLCLPDPNDYTETQYQDLPKVSATSHCPLASPVPLRHSEFTVSSREDCPVLRRSLYRGNRGSTSSLRSASLSPSRVPDFPARFEVDTVTSPRDYNSVISPRVYDPVFSSRSKEEPVYHNSYEKVVVPSQSHVRENQDHFIPKAGSSTKLHFLDYDRGNSDVEADQNTSGDLLNFSNLSLSDDGLLNDSEIPESPPYSHSVGKFNISPRTTNIGSKFVSSSLPMSQTLPRSHISPRDSYRADRYSPRTESISRPILTSSLRTDYSSSLPVSDSVQRILLSPPDPYLDVSSNISLSPRRHKPSWQTLHPSYLQQPRSAVRRTVTFTEPERGQYESKYLVRDDGTELYGGPYASLRRQSPTLPIANLELTDHERYLREKQGREKDAFQEKIQRLKELIQENKDQEMTGSLFDRGSKRNLSSSHLKGDNLDMDKSELHSRRDSSADKDNGQDDAHHSKSRRSSVMHDQASRRPSVELPLQSRRPSMAIVDTLESKSPDSGLDKIQTPKLKLSVNEEEEPDSEPISEKEQWSGKFSEKEDDVKEDEKEDAIKPEQVETDNIPIEQDTIKPDETQSSHQGQGSDPSGDPTDPKQEVDYSYLQDQQQEKQITDYNYEQDQPTQQNSDYSQNNYQPHQQTELGQSSEDYNYQQEQLQQNEADKYNYAGTQEQPPQPQSQPEWNSDQQQAPAQDQSVDYGYQQQQGDQSGGEFIQTGQDDRQYQQGNSYDSYPDGKPDEQVGYEAYEQNVQPQSTETGYETYSQEAQPAPEQSESYLQYSEDQGQYQQDYQNYPQDPQYDQQQNQDYVAPPGGDYSYQQDPNAASYQQDPNSSTYQQDPNTSSDYQYEGGEYNYQQDQSGYGYPESQAYAQDPSYQQDQQYSNYEYGSTQPVPEDLSEETTPSTDPQYQQQFTEGSADQQTVEQYRNLLGVDPNSEPAYSDSSELENQMAAVVSQAPGNIAKTPDQSPPAPAQTPTGGKTKATGKKKLTRKQSTISSDAVEGKQQPPSSLTKMQESESESASIAQQGQGNPEDSSDFDLSSTQ